MRAKRVSEFVALGVEGMSYDDALRHYARMVMNYDDASMELLELYLALSPENRKLAVRKLKDLETEWQSKAA